MQYNKWSNYLEVIFVPFLQRITQLEDGLFQRLVLGHFNDFDSGRLSWQHLFIVLVQCLARFGLRFRPVGILCGTTLLLERLELATL